MNFFQEVLSSLWGLSELLCKASYPLKPCIHLCNTVVTKVLKLPVCMLISRPDLPEVLASEYLKQPGLRKGRSRGTFTCRGCISEAVVPCELHHLFNLVECVGKGHPGRGTDPQAGLFTSSCSSWCLVFLGGSLGSVRGITSSVLLLDQVDGCYGNRARGTGIPFCQHRLVWRENHV